MTSTGSEVELTGSHDTDYLSDRHICRRRYGTRRKHRIHGNSGAQFSNLYSDLIKADVDSSEYASLRIPNHQEDSVLDSTIYDTIDNQRESSSHLENLPNSITEEFFVKDGKYFKRDFLRKDSENLYSSLRLPNLPIPTTPLKPCLCNSKNIDAEPIYEEIGPISDHHLYHTVEQNSLCPPVPVSSIEQNDKTRQEFAQTVQTGNIEPVYLNTIWNDRFERFLSTRTHELPPLDNTAGNYTDITNLDKDGQLSSALRLELTSFRKKITNKCLDDMFTGLRLSNQQDLDYVCPGVGLLFTDFNNFRISPRNAFCRKAFKRKYISFLK